MRSFESRLETLELGAPTSLQNFYEPHLKSFSVKPGSVEVRHVSNAVLLTMWHNTLTHVILWFATSLSL